MISEQDLELLEMHLDGELDTAEKAVLEQRIGSNAELAAELERVKQTRQARMQLWASAEPTVNVADRMLAKILVREEHRSWFNRILDNRDRIVAMAACIAVFLMGWQWGKDAGPYQMIQTGVPTAQPVRLITQEQVPAGQSSIFVVRVTDESGNIIKEQNFKTLAEAQNYIQKTRQDLNRK